MFGQPDCQGASVRGPSSPRHAAAAHCFSRCGLACSLNGACVEWWPVRPHKPVPLSQKDHEMPKAGSHNVSGSIDRHARGSRRVGRTMPEAFKTIEVRTLPPRN